MTVKQLRRKLDKYVKIHAAHLVTVHFKDGREEIMEWGDAVRLGIAEDNSIAEFSGAHTDLLNMLLHPVLDRHIEDFEEDCI